MNFSHLTLCIASAVNELVRMFSYEDESDKPRARNQVMYELTCTENYEDHNNAVLTTQRLCPKLSPNSDEVRGQVTMLEHLSSDFRLRRRVYFPTESSMHTVLKVLMLSNFDIYSICIRP